MIPCPRCKTPMNRANCYKCGEYGSVRRLSCPNCFLVATEQSFLVNVDPDKGEGAFALSKKLADKDLQIKNIERIRAKTK